MKAEISRFILTLNRLSHRAKAIQFLLLCFACLLFACSASLYLGSDVGFDLRNYHLYNAWALLNDRSEIDLFAAGMHTYFQPLLELPYYWLSFVFFPDSPKLVTFLMGIPGGIFIILTCLIVFSVLKSATKFPRIYLYLLSIPFIAFAISYSFFLQVGYTSGDLPVACFILCAVYVLLRYRERPLFATVLPALLIGIAVGLKFTAAVYSISFFFAFFFGFSAKKNIIPTAIVFGFSCAMGFLLTYGWWGWRLFLETGNPVFPVFDNFYPQWVYPSMVGNDIFVIIKRPTGMLNALYCFFTDYHFGFVNICIGSCLLLVVLKKWIYPFFPSTPFIKKIFYAGEPRRVLETIPYNKKLFLKNYLFLFTFYMGTFAIWRLRLSEIRYIMAIDALAGVLILLTILQLGSRKRKKFLHLSLLSIGILVIIKADLIVSRTTPESLKNMQHRAGWRSSIQETKWKLPKLPENTLVLTGVQTSFLAPFLAKETSSLTFVGGVSDSNTTNILPDSIMKQKITDKIKKHIGPIYLLTIPEINDPLIKAMNLRDEMGRPLLEINFFPQYGLELVQEKQIQISNKFGKFLLIPTRPETKIKNP